MTVTIMKKQKNVKTRLEWECLKTWVGIFQVGIFQGGSFMGGNFPGGGFLDTIFIQLK